MKRPTLDYRSPDTTSGPVLLSRRNRLGVASVALALFAVLSGVLAAYTGSMPLAFVAITFIGLAFTAGALGVIDSRGRSGWSKAGLAFSLAEIGYLYLLLHYPVH